MTIAANRPSRSGVQTKTSQPPPGDFRRAFEFLGSHYRAVVYVGLTARVSGTYQSGETAAGRARTTARGAARPPPTIARTASVASSR